MLIMGGAAPTNAYERISIQGENKRLKFSDSFSLALATLL
jgi:hypothetical protein